LEFLPDSRHAAACETGAIASWKAQLESGAAEIFGPDGGAAPQAVDVKLLHAKIGELTWRMIF
jgi:hypothetical protein